MERCKNCRKKTLMMCPCTCKQNFCIKCRMPETHNCSFDYKKAYQELLKLKNPKVEGKKVESI